VREDPDLHAALFGHGEAGPVQDGMQPEQALILSVYEAWLRSWKKVPAVGHWDLWIGFERNPEAIQELWRSPLDSFHSDLIHLRVRSTGRNQGPRWESGSRTSEGQAIPAFDDSLLMEEPYRKCALVFDNHGACFSESVDSEKGLDFQKACRFYQRLSGSETPDLFRLLFRPPNNSFAFSFLIHALVEACLANVAVVDERLAADLLFRVPGRGIDEGNFFSRLASHQKAGVFPVFSFKKRLNSEPDHANMNLRYGFYTEEHHKKMSELIPWPGKPKNPNLADEGVHFEVNAAQSSAELSFIVPQVLKDNGVCRLLPSSEYPCDVLIIHEGALDILAKQVGVDWKRDYATTLYSISPIIIRTSGRGRHTQHMLDAIPFVEFNEISSAVLTSRNKYSLVRALLGTAGSIPSATQR
jgi:hypothetical protein